MKKTSITLTILIAMHAIFGLCANAQYTKLLDFAGTTNGANPFASLISDGSFLYGTTEKGGTNNIGTIFKIMPDGSGYLKLHDFAGGAANGWTPRGELFYDGTFLWGMTNSGGAHADGIIFRIMPDGSGFQNVFNFLSATSGKGPEGSFISDGTFLYGMTFSGGTNNFGTIFKIMLNGTGYTKIFDFEVATNGRWPHGSLISDGAYLYGMTSSGGTNNVGTIFKIMPDGSGFIKLLDFESSTSGGNPRGSLFSDGTFLYGMALDGGATGNGTIFKIMPNGSGYVKLLDLNSLPTGSRPMGTLISVGGFLYGMTSMGGVNGRGTIFKIMPDGSGFMKLLDFEGASNGGDPFGSLFSDGNFLYGMTLRGGTDNYGVIFRMGTTTGIYDNNENDKTAIFPNPAFDFVTLNIAGEINDVLTLNIYNVMGTLVKSEILKQNNRQINIGYLGNGIYIMEIKSKEWSEKQKLIINR